MSTYVIGDIHGEYQQLRDLLEKMNFCDEDDLYVLGDVVDRGPNPIRALLYLMTLPNCTCLIGNHEVMALQCLRFWRQEITEESIQAIDEEKINMLNDWIQNGGLTTIEEFRELNPLEQENVMDFMGEFLAYEELTVGEQEYILVHAGLGDEFSVMRPMEDYYLDELVWHRTSYDIPYFEDKIVITGHTPTQLIECNPRPGYIFRENNHIALDCCAHSSQGRLAGICLETGEEFYSR